MTSNSPLLIAQVTDIHLFAHEQQELLGLPTDRSFQAVLQRLRGLDPQPDLLLLTGDLSQDGTAIAYERLQAALLPLGIPVYWLPGNHDCLPMMQQVLHQFPVMPEKVFDVGCWNFLLLNSGVPGCVYGELSDESLDWLDAQLQQLPQRPTLIALHHPPFLVNSKWLDTSTLRNPEALWAVIDRYPQVKLVLFGHIHQEFCQQRQGVSCLGTPSTSIQFEPESNNFALDCNSPGFRLVNLYPDGSWTTQVERVECVHQLDLVASGY
ncbi:MAG TPA: 3',5'-cyclic-AMP phosphodiesterase [Allocoleopsis sp.]